METHRICMLASEMVDFVFILSTKNDVKQQLTKFKTAYKKHQIDNTVPAFATELFDAGIDYVKISVLEECDKKDVTSRKSHYISTTINVNKLVFETKETKMKKLMEPDQFTDDYKLMRMAKKELNKKRKQNQKSKLK